MTRKNIAPLLCLGLSVTLFLQGCSTKLVGRSSNTPSDAYADVRIQVCLPSKRIYFNDLELDQLENHPSFTKYSQQQLELAPKIVRRVASSSNPRVINDSRVIHVYGIRIREVLSQRGLFSWNSGFMPLKDSTILDQPVYEKEYGHPTQDYVAISVSENGPEGTVEYWFKLPKRISTDSFTDWLDPVSMETDKTRSGDRFDIAFKLTHGIEMPIYPVSEDSPKMRVTLYRHHTEHNDPTSDSLPALTTARMKYRNAGVYEFVPKTNEEIPKCD
ncbi:MAG: hypothetical protein P4L44_02160 [Oryzomonas sp.]|uniref:hypothetical protein n=1 Tax=Oryzomonas sp. TaxID=2855186 RepID=UPI00283DFEFB|nr:hypothetical protein [Oryzomonas sp.]MDR3578746.1 hypothetical protein [Oryzomonas sp.]